MSRSADVLVVGAGAIGCSAALALAREGLSVVVVERDAVGAHASSVAAGMLTPLAEAHGAADTLPLGVESLESFPALVGELLGRGAADPHYRVSGLLRVAGSDAEAESLRARAQRLAAHGAEWLDAAALGARGLGLGGAPRGALWSPREGHVDAARLTRAYAAVAASLGVRIACGERAASLETDAGRVIGLRSTSGLWTAPVVVLATGAWAAAEPRAGLRLPVRPLRGQIVSLDGCPLGPIVWGESVYLVPRVGDALLVGATVEEVGFDCRVTAAGVRSLLDAATRLLPGLAEARFTGALAGLRPATPDGLPLVGAAPGLAGLVLAAGHHRNGILLSPITARLVADTVLGRPLPAAAQAFAPDRFAAPAPASFTAPGR